MNASEVEGIISARVVKTLMGNGASFACIRKRGVVIIYRGVVYAKMFYGGWCCFPAGWHPLASHPPLNSSTGHNTDKLREVQVYVRQWNSVRSPAKLLGVDCMTLKRFHHCHPSIGISHIKLAAVKMAKNYGIELLTVMEQYCLSFNFTPYNLC